MPTSNSFLRPTGQTGTHSAHLVQASVTYLGFSFTLTVKSPASPSRPWTSEQVRSSMLGWSPTSLILGDSMQIEQSSVGKFLSRTDIFPPIVGSLSTRTTFAPALAASREACMPAIPPPMMTIVSCSDNAGRLLEAFGQLEACVEGPGVELLRLREPFGECLLQRLRRNPLRDR